MCLCIIRFKIRDAPKEILTIISIDVNEVRVKSVKGFILQDNN